MKRSTLRVLLTRAGDRAPRGYFAARTCPDTDVRVRLWPSRAVIATGLARPMVRS